MTSREALDGAQERALALAYRYVNRRERTVQELRTHLSQRELPPAAVAQAIDALQRDGLVDDARFVRLFVEDRRTLDGWGSDRIERALRQRGVDRDLIDRTLRTGDAAAEERERAVMVLRRRWPTPPSDGRERERALGVLLRKGYDSEVALDALDAHARGDE